MKRTISSTAHSAFKMCVLAASVLFGVTLLSWSLDAGAMRWDLLFGPGIVLAAFLWFAASRKTIQMDERFLYISTFRKTTTIPLDQIARVSETIGMKDRYVTIYFRSETPLGRSVSFTPTFRFTRDPHPIVIELRRFADHHELTGNA